MTGRNFDHLIGRGFIADGLGTMIAGSGGGTGVTTYAENMGVMAVTRVYSTLVFVAAGIIALVLGFSPKFGAVIGTIPVAVLGGLAVVVFGLIAATAGRIWVENKVDFSEPKNLITVATALILGAGDLKLPIFGFELGEIGDLRRDHPLSPAEPPYGLTIHSAAKPFSPRLKKLSQMGGQGAGPLLHAPCLTRLTPLTGGASWRMGD